jgi:hypothetical protein
LDNFQKPGARRLPFQSVSRAIAISNRNGLERKAAESDVQAQRAAQEECKQKLNPEDGSPWIRKFWSLLILITIVLILIG